MATGETRISTPHRARQSHRRDDRDAAEVPAFHHEPKHWNSCDLERNDLEREDPDVDPVATREVDPDQCVRGKSGDGHRDDRGRNHDRQRVRHVGQQRTGSVAIQSNCQLPVEIKSKRTRVRKGSPPTRAILIGLRPEGLYENACGRNRPDDADYQGNQRCHRVGQTLAHPAHGRVGAHWDPGGWSVATRIYHQLSVFFGHRPALALVIWRTW
jgi:hypothetical protein